MQTDPLLPGSVSGCIGKELHGRLATFNALEPGASRQPFITSYVIDPRGPRRAMYI